MKLNKLLSLLCVGFLAIGTVACGDSDSSSDPAPAADTPTTRASTANTTVQTTILTIAAGVDSSVSPALTKTTETFEDQSYDCDPGTVTYSGEYDTDLLTFTLEMLFDGCDGLDGTVNIAMDYDLPTYGFVFNGELTYEDDCVITYTDYGYAFDETSILLNGEFSAVCGDGSAGCDFTGGDDDDTTGIEVVYDAEDAEAFVTDLVAAYEENCTEE